MKFLTLLDLDEQLASKPAIEYLLNAIIKFGVDKDKLVSMEIDDEDQSFEFLERLMPNSKPLFTQGTRLVRAMVLLHDLVGSANSNSVSLVSRLITTVEAVNMMPLLNILNDAHDSRGLINLSSETPAADLLISELKAKKIFIQEACAIDYSKQYPDLSYEAIRKDKKLEDIEGTLDKELFQQIIDLLKMLNQSKSPVYINPLQFINEHWDTCKLLMIKFGEACLFSPEELTLPLLQQTLLMKKLEGQKITAVTLMEVLTKLPAGSDMQLVQRLDTLLEIQEGRKVLLPSVIEACVLETKEQTHVELNQCLLHAFTPETLCTLLQNMSGSARRALLAQSTYSRDAEMLFHILVECQVLNEEDILTLYFCGDCAKFQVVQERYQTLMREALRPKNFLSSAAPLSAPGSRESLNVVPSSSVPPVPSAPPPELGVVQTPPHSNLHSAAIVYMPPIVPNAPALHDTDARVTAELAQPAQQAVVVLPEMLTRVQAYAMKTLVPSNPPENTQFEAGKVGGLKPSTRDRVKAVNFLLAALLAARDHGQMQGLIDLINEPTFGKQAGEADFAKNRDPKNSLWQIILDCRARLLEREAFFKDVVNTADNLYDLLIDPTYYAALLAADFSLLYAYGNRVALAKVIVLNNRKIPDFVFEGATITLARLREIYLLDGIHELQKVYDIVTQPSLYDSLTAPELGLIYQHGNREYFAQLIVKLHQGRGFKPFTFEGRLIDYRYLEIEAEVGLWADPGHLQRKLVNEAWVAGLLPQHWALIYSYVNPTLFAELLVFTLRGQGFKTFTTFKGQEITYPALTTQVLGQLTNPEQLKQRFNDQSFVHSLQTEDLTSIFTLAERETYCRVLVSAYTHENFPGLRIQEASVSYADMLQAVRDLESDEIDCRNRARYFLQLPQQLPADAVYPGAQSDQHLSPEAAFQLTEDEIACGLHLLRQSPLLTVPPVAGLNYYLMPVVPTINLPGPDGLVNDAILTSNGFKDLKRLLTALLEDSVEPLRKGQCWIITGILNVEGNHYLNYFVSRSKQGLIQVFPFDPSPEKTQGGEKQVAMTKLANIFRALLVDFGKDHEIIIQDPNVTAQLQERDCGFVCLQVLEDIFLSQRQLFSIGPDARLLLNPALLTLNGNHEKTYDFARKFFCYSQRLQNACAEVRELWAERFRQADMIYNYFIDTKPRLHQRLEAVPTGDNYRYDAHVKRQFGGDEMDVVASFLSNILHSFENTAYVGLLADRTYMNCAVHQYQQRMRLPSQEETGQYLTQIRLQFQGLVRQNQVPIENDLSGLRDGMSEEEMAAYFDRSQADLRENNDSASISWQTLNDYQARFGVHLPAIVHRCVLQQLEKLHYSVLFNAFSQFMATYVWHASPAIHEVFNRVFTDFTHHPQFAPIYTLLERSQRRQLQRELNEGFANTVCASYHAYQTREFSRYVESLCPRLIRSEQLPFYDLTTHMLTLLANQAEAASLLADLRHQEGQGTHSVNTLVREIIYRYLQNQNSDHVPVYNAKIASASLSELLAYKANLCLLEPHFVAHEAQAYFKTGFGAHMLMSNIENHLQRHLEQQLSGLLRQFEQHEIRPKSVVVQLALLAGDRYAAFYEWLILHNANAPFTSDFIHHGDVRTMAKPIVLERLNLMLRLSLQTTGDSMITDFLENFPLETVTHGKPQDLSHKIEAWCFEWLQARFLSQGFNAQKHYLAAKELFWDALQLALSQEQARRAQEAGVIKQVIVTLGSCLNTVSQYIPGQTGIVQAFEGQANLLQSLLDFALKQSTLPEFNKALKSCETSLRQQFTFALQTLTQQYPKFTHCLRPLLCELLSIPPAEDDAQLDKQVIARLKQPPIALPRVTSPLQTPDKPVRLSDIEILLQAYHQKNSGLLTTFGFWDESYAQRFNFLLLNQRAEPDKAAPEPSIKRLEACLAQLKKQHASAQLDDRLTHVDILSLERLLIQYSQPTSVVQAGLFRVESFAPRQTGSAQDVVYSFLAEMVKGYRRAPEDGPQVVLTPEFGK